MNTQSNLAFKLDLDTESEVLETVALSAAELDDLLRLGSRQADASVSVRTRSVRNRRSAPVRFQDNHSDAFRPFKVY